MDHIRSLYYSAMDFYANVNPFGRTFKFTELGVVKYNRKFANMESANRYLTEDNWPFQFTKEPNIKNVMKLSVTKNNYTFVFCKSVCTGSLFYTWIDDEREPKAYDESQAAMLAIMYSYHKKRSLMVHCVVPDSNGRMFVMHQENEFSITLNCALPVYLDECALDEIHLDYLKNMTELNEFKKTVENMLKLYQISPKMAVEYYIPIHPAEKLLPN